MSELCVRLFVVVCVVYYFFFFKQKTAYEMRISDWSSDVCSSDLPLDEIERERKAARANYVEQQAAKAAALAAAGDAAAGDTAEAAADGDEIGRASCRERVCQYV